MMKNPVNQISLTGTIATRGTAPASSQDLQPGIHLRWSFDPEMGYPRNGFALYRGKIGGNDNSPDVSLLTLWSFDLSYETLFSVHTDRFPGYAEFLTECYGFNRVIEQVFEQLQSIRPTDLDYHRWLHQYSEATDKKAQISKIDSILLAATDPHIARFAGLYHVDDQLPTTDGELLRYWVVGDWGDQRYPKKRFDLKNTPQQELGLSIHKPGLEIIAGGGYFQNARSTTVESDPQAYDRIWYRGAGGRTLSFVLDEPVEVFRLKGSFSGVGAIFLDGQVHQPVLSDPTQIEINRLARPFTRIDLLINPRDGIHLDELYTRRKSGSIGVVRSPDYYLSSFLNEALVAGIEPQMGVPFSEPATPILDNQGRLALPKSQIVLPASYYNPSLTFPLQPLAYVFGKTLGDSEQVTPQLALNNDSFNQDRAPALRREPKEMLPDLAAWFKLDDTYTDAKTKDSALPHGKLRFAKTGIGPERIPIDERYPSLRTIGERALCFDGSSYLSLVNFPDLQNLAGDFTISLRCLCGRFNIGTTRTLLGSDSEEGLFIGISPTGNISEQLQLHLRIGDTVIEQPQWRFVNAWQTISLVVRHGRGQIYLNYSPFGTEFPFPAEKNLFTGRTLCLGGTPNAPANRNFRGYLADVQFWHRAIDPRTAALKLAQQADLLSQYLPLRPAFQAPETLTFDAQNRWRRFVQPDLRELTSFSIQFWMKPVFTPGQIFVVVQAPGNNGTNNGIGIGLSGIDRKLYFKIFPTNWQYQTDEWTHVCITYDFQQLKFFINGHLDKVYNFRYRFSASDNWFHLGAANTGEYPYQGEMADFRIYKLPLPPTALKMRGPILHYPQIHTFQPGDAPVSDYSLALASIKEQMAVFFWVYPDFDGNIIEPYIEFKNYKSQVQVYSLTDNGAFNEFFIALIRTNYYPQRMFSLAMVLGEEEGFVAEKIAIQSRTWTHIGIVWDGEKISFFINGLLADTFVNDLSKSISIPTTLGLKKFMLQLGNKLLLPGGNNRLSSQFIGQIADFQLWDQAISPTELRDLAAPPYFTDTNIDDGTYTYYVQGIDLWGQKSEWSLPRTVEVKSAQTFHAPAEVKAAFVPIQGTVKEVVTTPKSEGHPQSHVITIELHTPFAGSPNALSRYEALLSREATRTVFGGQQRYRLRQPYEIATATPSADGLVLTLLNRPFAQLNPLPGDAVIIAFDQDYVVSWAWTGIQQLYNPAVNRFLIYLKSGKWNEFVAPILSVNPAEEGRFLVQTNLNLPPEEFIGEYASVENRIYKIKEYTEGQITLNFGGDPVVAPPVGSLLNINVPEISSLYTSPLDKTNYAHHFVVPDVTPFQAWEPLYNTHYQAREGTLLTKKEIEGLRAKIEAENWPEGVGLDWLPEKNVIRFELSGIHTPLPGDMPTNRANNFEEAQSLRQNYIPGALVSMCAIKEKWAYRLFYVFWHEVRLQADGRMHFIAYLSAPEGEGPDFKAEDISFAGGAPTRFYYGRKFIQQLSLPFDSLPSFEYSPSQEFSVAIEATTTDQQIRGELSARATLLAADRRMAAPGPRPTILSFGKPAFDGQADCIVEWDSAPDALGYQLYRAVDTALFECDLEQRRKREAGSDYAEGSPETVFRDDPDFMDWFNAYRHRNPVPAWTNLDDLFARRINPAWEALHGFWYDWLKAFYPKDWEQKEAELILRRRREGPFKGWSFEQVLTNPAGQPDWLAPHTNGRPLADFFPPEINPAWLAAHPFWRAWADRFYPALTDSGIDSEIDSELESEIEALANRPGNESVFTIVHNEPLNPPVLNGRATYTDQVNGTVSNRYLYRVRVLGRNLQTGPWSKASAPLALSTPAAPPRAPVFTKVEAGDRQITLQWALNREPDLLGYTLYRAEDAALLADLRWADAMPIPGVTSIFIPDPRIVTRWDENGEAYILLPGDSPITSASQIRGIYRVEEFDAKAERVEVQPGAMDYRGEVTVGSELIGGRAYRKIAGLRKVAKGVEMVLLWWDPAYGIQVMTSIGEYPYVDRKVQGLKDYYYRIASLVALGSASLRSDASEVMRAKALEVEPPEVPEFTILREAMNGSERIILLTGEDLTFLKIAIQWRKQWEKDWQNKWDWSQENHYETIVPTGEKVSFRIICKTINNTLSLSPMILHSR